MCMCGVWMSVHFFCVVVRLLYLYFVFFFFKQKTAYEMRISDWSSDVCSSDLWMEASRHGFLTGDHRGMAAVLSAAAVKRDLAPEARIGPAGIAMLPNRAPPEGQRYRVTLAKAREELERYLPAARQQAAERLRELIGESAPSTAIANARTELAYVRHAKGPIYQSHLLTYLGVRQVDAVVTAQQTPLERVRAIGA